MESYQIPSISQKRPNVIFILLLLIIFLIGAGGIVFTYVTTPKRIQSETLSRSPLYNPDDPLYQQSVFADTNSKFQTYSSSRLNLSFVYDGGKWVVSEWPLNLTLTHKATRDTGELVYETVIISTFTPLQTGASLTRAQNFFETQIIPKIKNFTNFQLLKKYSSQIGTKDVFVSDYSYSDIHENLIYVKDYIWIKDTLGIHMTYSVPGKSAISVSDVEAMISSLETANPITTSPQVRGASTSIDEGERIVVENKPAVVRIYKRVCGELKNLTLPAPSMAGKTYKYCYSSWGSGFFVDPKGIIATNGHVAVVSKEEALIGSIMSGYSYDLLKDLIRDVIKEKLMAQQDLDISRVLDSEIDLYIDKYIKDTMLSNPDGLLLVATGLIEEINKGTITVNNTLDETYIQNSTTPILINKDGSVKNITQVQTAEIVGFDYESPLKQKDAEKFTASDVALLKVVEGNYPAVLLGDSTNLELGTPIYVIGFPGISTDLNLLDENSKVQQTVTKGIVSAIKNAAGDKKKLIQIDASIAGGNSGGPALTKDGKVVGIATYKVLSESADFNFLRDIGDLKVLMGKYAVSNVIGPVSIAWREGLMNYSQKYFKRAAVNFAEVKKLYAQHPDVDKYMEQVENKIKAGEDLTPVFTFLNHDYGKFEATVMGISIGMMAVSGLFLIVTLLHRPKFVYAPNPNQQTSFNQYTTAQPAVLSTVRPQQIPTIRISNPKNIPQQPINENRPVNSPQVTFENLPPPIPR